MWCDAILAGCQYDDGTNAAARVVHIASGKTAASDVDKAISGIGAPRTHRFGVVGSISYTFPGVCFRAQGAEALRAIRPGHRWACQTAEESVRL